MKSVPRYLIPGRTYLFAALAVLPSAAQSSSTLDTSILHYTARLRGVPLLEATICLRLTPTTYTAAILARTLGLAEFLVHARAEGHADGGIDGTTMKPRAYAERSRLAGEDYRIGMTFPTGNPVLQMETPPQAKYRESVQPRDIQGAIDGLSAIALESLTATRTGTCQGTALVYDGRQLRRATTQPAGHDVLEPNARSVFSGPALRCNTESIMLAGFLKSQPQKPQQRPRHSAAWLAPALRGGPDIPVKVIFDADFLGDIVVNLDAASRGDGSACVTQQE